MSGISAGNWKQVWTATWTGVGLDAVVEWNQGGDDARGKWSIWYEEDRKTYHLVWRGTWKGGKMAREPMEIWLSRRIWRVPGNCMRQSRRRKRRPDRRSEQRSDEAWRRLTSTGMWVEWKSNSNQSKISD